jgi:acyl-CoA thioesterase
VSADGLPADLAADTAVRRVGPGRWAAELSDRWNWVLPCGGVLMTVALRAIAAELGDDALRPVSATTIFCAPVAAGPLAIAVTPLRRGGLASQVRAALSAADGSPGLEVVATFGREREGVDVGRAAPPDVPRPDALPAATNLGAPNFLRNFDRRRALGTAWWRPEAWVPGDESGEWYRYLRPQRCADGRLDPLALPPLVDTMPPAMFAMLGPSALAMHAPSLDLTVHFVEDTRREWLLTRARCRRARAGYATADIEVWDDEGRLLAFGAQVMALRRRPGA